MSLNYSKDAWEKQSRSCDLPKAKCQPPTNWPPTSAQRTPSLLQFPEGASSTSWGLHLQTPSAGPTPMTLSLL